MSNNRYGDRGHMCTFATMEKEEVQRDALYANSPLRFLWHSIPLYLAQSTNLFIRISPPDGHLLFRFSSPNQ